MPPMAFARMAAEQQRQRITHPSQSTSLTNPRNTQQTDSETDPYDLIGTSEYDSISYQSHSASQVTSTKSEFANHNNMAVMPTTLPLRRNPTGPSHQYDQDKQHTSVVTEVSASTLTISANANGSRSESLPPPPPVTSNVCRI